MHTPVDNKREARNVRGPYGRRFRSYAEIIVRLGGGKPLARALGLPNETVAAWKRRDHIPPAHWVSIVRLAERKGVGGVTYERLAKLAVRKPS